MRKTLCALLLAGCASLPVDNTFEAKPVKEQKGVVIRVLPHYEILSEKIVDGDRRIINMTLGLHGNLAERESEFMPFFGLLKRIARSNPGIELDIIAADGAKYPVHRLAKWSGIYDAPVIILKDTQVNVGIMVHEFCHSTDQYYSKWGYLFSRAHRCRMEAVAVSGEMFFGDYFGVVYGLDNLANNLRSRASLDIMDFFNEGVGLATFEEVYDRKDVSVVARMMAHILLDSFGNDTRKTYFFLRSNDCANVYKMLYQHLRSRNYRDAVNRAMKR